MAWIDGSSFQYDSKGWTMSGSIGTGFARVAGGGQSGLPSLKATVGVVVGADYGFTALTELITGFCLKFTENTALGGFLQLHQSGSLVFQLYVDVDGSVVAFDMSGTDTEIGRSASGVVGTNVENYIEVRVLASTTVGEVEVRLNGDPTPVLDLTNVDTGATSYNQMSFINNPVHGDADFSAWYFLDTTGPAPFNDFLGHIRYAPLDPTANGANSDLAGSDGNSINNFELVDDGASSINHDSDATYVQSATVGNKDTYSMENLPSTPLLVYGVQTIIVARKTDAGSRGVTPVIRSGGTDYNAATEHFLGTSYDTFKQMVAQDPDGPATWDETSVNAMELGVEITT